MERREPTQPGDERIARLERRVAELEQTLARPPAPAPPSASIAPTAQRAPLDPLPPRRPPARQFDLDSLLTTRTLAWLGGGVLLLGLAFFLAIAVDRGWINEPARIVLGVLFSGGLLVFAGVLRGRYGRLEAGLVAAGAGIAGLLFSDLAAGPLYELFSDPVTIIVALAVAALAVALAIYWSAETVAGVGLVGAMLAAPLILSDIRLSGLCVVAIALAAAGLLMIARDWKPLMLACVAASLPQAIIWIGTGANADLHAQQLLITGGFWALVFAPALARELLHSETGIDPRTLTMVLVATSFAVIGLLFGVEGTTLGLEREGFAVGALGVGYIVATAALWVYGGSGLRRDLRSLLGGAGLALVGLALFLLFKHHTLVIVLAIESVLLAWLGRALDEERLTLAAAVYMSAALVYLVAFEAPPTLLFDSGESPGIEMLSVAAAAAGSAGLAWLSSGEVRKVAAWTAGGLVIYLGSLAIVAILASPAYGFEETNISFQRAQTVVSIFWGAVGFTLMVVGLRRVLPVLRTAGFVLLGLALAKAFLFDLSSLTAFARALSFLGLGTLLLVAAVVHQRLSRPPEDVAR